MATKRSSCKARTKAGKRCKGTPLRGSDLCMAHSPAKVRESRGFIARNGKQGRPKLPTPSEVARKLIEENILALQRPYWRALGYDVRIGEHGPELVERNEGGAKLFGESKEGVIRLSSIDDLEAMQKAAERLQDRVYGRPTSKSEVKADVTHTNQTEFDREVQELNAKVRANGNGRVRARS